MSPSTDRPRRALSRQLILDTAIRYVDQHGLAALNMRKLGELLGVEAMSIYHHVNGREDLLEGVVARLVADIRVPPSDDLGPVDGWQAYVQHVAQAVRGLALAHPNLFPLVATRPPAAPWLRPPLRDLQLVEDFLDGLLSRGVAEEHAVHVYKVFTSFLLGHLLLEVAQVGAETAPPEEPLDEGGASTPNADQQVPLENFPTIRRLEPRLRHHDADVEFADALDALLVRLDNELSQ